MWLIRWRTRLGGCLNADNGKWKNIKMCLIFAKTFVKCSALLRGYDLLQKLCFRKFVWGYSSDGRATGSQSVGREFDPPYLHHKNKKTAPRGVVFLFLGGGRSELRKGVRNQARGTWGCAGEPKGERAPMVVSFCKKRRTTEPISTIKIKRLHRKVSFFYF